MILPLKSSIVDGLENEYNSIEEVHGNNAVYCNNCKTKTSSILQKKLHRNMPPLIFGSLNRFAYNHYTLTRNKLSTACTIPMELDMKKYILSQQQEKELQKQYIQNNINKNNENENENNENNEEEDIDIKMDELKINIVDNVETDNDINLQLNIENNRDDDKINYIYKLAGITIHSGTSAGSGHYFTIFNTKYNGFTDDTENDNWCMFNDKLIKSANATFQNVQSNNAFWSPYIFTYISTNINCSNYNTQIPELLKKRQQEAENNKNLNLFVLNITYTDNHVCYFISLHNILAQTKNVYIIVFFIIQQQKKRAKLTQVQKVNYWKNIDIRKNQRFSVIYNLLDDISPSDTIYYLNNVGNKWKWSIVANSNTKVCDITDINEDTELVIAKEEHANLMTELCKYREETIKVRINIIQKDDEQSNKIYLSPETTVKEMMQIVHNIYQIKETDPDNDMMQMVNVFNEPMDYNEDEIIKQYV